MTRRAPRLYVSTRREVLAGLLGAPFALSLGAAACRGRTPDVRFEGGFVDRALEDGHRLRDGFRPSPPAGEPARRARVLILGGGIAGLTAGWQLVRAGVEDVLLLELEDRPGGTSSSGRSEVSAYPWGAHYLPAPAPRPESADLLELLRDTGTVIGTDARGAPRFDETQLCAAPKERIFFRGLWHEGLFPGSGASADELAELSRFERALGEWIAARDASGRRIFTLPIAAGALDGGSAGLDRISAADWLAERKFISPLLRWYVEYACRDDFGAELSETSAWSMLHYFCARTERPGGESAEFLTWPEGNGFLAEHLARGLGAARIAGGLMVTSVTPAADGVRIVAWDRRASRAREFLASRVIFALPSFLRSRVLAEFPEIPRYEVRYSPWLVANLHLRACPASHGFPVAWDNVVYGSRSLGYVVATHQKPRAGGETVWTYYLPFTGKSERSERARLASLSYAEAADAILSELSACHLELPPLVKRVDIHRWGHGMVRPVPGSAFSSERALASRPVGRLHFAHTDLSGVALFEEAFFQGTRAAREVLSAFRGG